MLRAHARASLPTPRRAALRVALAVAALGLGALATPAVAATPAGATSASTTSGSGSSAGEVYRRPAGSNPVFHLAGHGWGHGHGLSQTGADGAALQGLSGAQITDFYYPGTELGSLPDAPLRVRVGCDAGASQCPGVVLSGRQGLVLTDEGAPAAQPTPLPTTYARYRVSRDASGYHVEGEDPEHQWVAYPAPGATYAGPLDLAPAQGSDPPVVRVSYSRGPVSWREYRGAMRVVAVGTSDVEAVDVLGMEDYLLGVVPRESPSRWPDQALVAQAIAARTYAAYERAHAPSSRAFDICDTTACQVYGGYALGRPNGSGGDDVTLLEAPSSTDAVHCAAAQHPCAQSTTPQVRTYQGQPIFAQFSASDGGWTSDGGQPYLVARADPYDGVPQARAERAAGHPLSQSHSWTATLPVSALERAFRAKGLGHLVDLRITRRDGHGEWGGRVRTVVLDGVDAHGHPTRVETTGLALLNTWMWPGHADGLRHQWFTVTDPQPTAEEATATPVLTAPRTAPRGGQVVLTGTATGAGVDLAWTPAGGAVQHVRLVPDAHHRFRTALPVRVDLSAYVTAGAARSRTVTVRAVGTTIAGPASVSRGAVAVVSGLAAPGSTVVVCWREAGHRGCAATTRTRAAADAGWTAQRQVTRPQRVRAVAAHRRSRELVIRVAGAPRA